MPKAAKAKAKARANGARTRASVDLMTSGSRMMASRQVMPERLMKGAVYGMQMTLMMTCLQLLIPMN